MGIRLQSLSRSEYTGENRCWPCTVLNALLVGLFCVVVGRRRRGLAVLGAAVGAVAIYLRGYVVPYTPVFAPRLTDALGLTSGHATPGSGHRSPDHDGDASLLAVGTGRDVDEAAGEELFGTLLEVGVLAAEGETVTLSAAVEERWEAEMADLRALGDDALAQATLDASAAVDAWPVADDSWVTAVTGERRYVVLSDGSDSVAGETWLERPVAIAETAAVRALEAEIDDPETRRRAASAMRVFLETCPDCGTELVETTTAVCCGASGSASNRPHEVLACPECDVRVHTFD